MRYGKLLESLEKKNTTFRRYSLPQIISESYKLYYDCEDSSNMKKLVEAHLDDVRSNPSDIERLSRQLCNINNIKIMLESDEMKDSELLVPEEKFTKVEPEEKVEESVHDEDVAEEDDENLLDESQHDEDVTEEEDEDLLEETELSDEEVEELTKHLEEIRKNKKVSECDTKKAPMKESTKGRKMMRRTVEAASDMYEPSKEEADKIISYIKKRYGNSVKEQDYLNAISKFIDSDGVSTDIIDYTAEKAGIEITESSKKYEEEIEEGIFDSKATKQKEYEKAIQDSFGMNSAAVVNKIVIAAADLVSAATEQSDSDKDTARDAMKMIKGAQRAVKDSPLNVLTGLISFGRKYASNENALDDLQELHQSLRKLQKMDKVGYKAMQYLLEKLSPALLKKFEETTRFLKKEYGIAESVSKSEKTYESLNLSEFSKKSANKAFVKTFKKLDSKLHEGTALTRQESIQLYKATNSAMTHLSVELEHNPGFLSTFKESVTLLSEDVEKLLLSLKEGKAPSKANMKSLAKFSEAILREDEEEELPPIEDEENDSISEEEEEYLQDYADAYIEAREEIHDEMEEKYGDSEDPAVQDLLAQDAEQVEQLKGEESDEEVPEENEEVTEESPEAVEDIEVEESSEHDEDVEELEEEELSLEGDEDDITEEEIEALKKHLTEMRKAKKCK